MNFLSKMGLLAAVFAGSIACGPVDSVPYDLSDEALSVGIEGGDELGGEGLENLTVATCSGETTTTTSTTGYRGNPDGGSCALASKFNADIDAGYDMSEADYDAFEYCMIEAGCFTPGAGMTLSRPCYKALAACQKHLIGEKKAKRLKVRSKYKPKNPITWREFSKKL